MPLDNVAFIIRNVGWSALNAKQALEVQKAMNIYRKSHPVCEITGSKKKVQVHHIRPVWLDPSLATDPNNFISLSAKAHIHLIFGHDGNFGQKCVSNIKEIAEKIRDIKKESVIIKRIETKEMSFFKKIWKKITGISD